MADEVGLGKTIVAGLILEDLLMHQPDANVLILVPGNLRKQWAEEELPGFFGRNVAWDFGSDLLQAAAHEPVILFALDHAKGDAKDNALATVLMQRRWDLVILDEAYDCKNAESKRVVLDTDSILANVHLSSTRFSERVLPGATSRQSVIDIGFAPAGALREM